VIYRVAQEALTNVLRHAAASQVTIRLTGADRGALLVVRDDGHGLPEAMRGGRAKGAG
jgi:signal transduction histidine kinase